MGNSEFIGKIVLNDNQQINEADKQYLHKVAIRRQTKFQQLQKMRLDIKRRIQSKNEDKGSTDETKET